MADKMILASVLYVVTLCLTAQGAKVGEACAANGACLTNAECVNASRRCFCNNVTQANTALTNCVAKVGGNCVDNDDCPLNGWCQINVCACSYGFKRSLNAIYCKSGASALQVSLLVVMAAIAASILW